LKFAFGQPGNSGELCQLAIVKIFRRTANSIDLRKSELIVVQRSCDAAAVIKRPI
jgi:hypothetical protein